MAITPPAILFLKNPEWLENQKSELKSCLTCLRRCVTKFNMDKNLMESELFFEVLTPLGFGVRVTRSYRSLIVTLKHPVMAGCESDVKETLTNPDEIRLSKTDPDVYLFYRAEHLRRWICAVVKRLDREGFLITAYPADKIKEGKRIWKK